MIEIKCQKCGHVNDADASFCENCGLSLKESKRMPKSTKILIVVVIVLVGFLCLTAGYILQGYLFKTNNTTIANQTNNTTTNSTNNLNQQSNNNQNNEVMISATEAMQIATDHLGGYGIHGAGASLSQGNNHPVWIVTLLDNKTNRDAGKCAVDATTGEFLG